MPLPIAHSAAGIASVLLFAPLADARESRRAMALAGVAAVAANLPDLDFLPGILMGRPGLYHHGPSHSLLAALVIGVAALTLVKPWFRWLDGGRLALVVGAAVVSHPLLDVLSFDSSYPHGVPLLWPFIEQYQVSPIPLFSDVVRSDTSNADFFLTLMNAHNARNVIAESFFAGSLVAGVSVIRQEMGSRQSTRLLVVALCCAVLFVAVRLLGR